MPAAHRERAFVVDLKRAGVAALVVAEEQAADPHRHDRVRAAFRQIPTGPHDSLPHRVGKKARRRQLLNARRLRGVRFDVNEVEHGHQPLSVVRAPAAAGDGLARVVHHPSQVRRQDRLALRCGAIGVECRRHRHAHRLLVLHRLGRAHLAVPVRHHRLHKLLVQNSSAKQFPKEEQLPKDKQHSLRSGSMSR